MPPKKRGVREGSTASVLTSSSSSSSNHPNADHLCKDPWHNGDQPCCKLLTEIAYRIFPDSSIQQTDETGSSRNGKQQQQQPSSNDHQDPLATWLRQYLLEERFERRRKSAIDTSISTYKKKRKKKKKKKGNGSSFGTADGEVEENSKETMDEHEEDARDQATSESVIKANHVTAMGETTGFVIPEESTSTSDMPLDNVALQRKERLRRSRIILDHFLDERIRSSMQQQSLSDSNHDSSTGERILLGPEQLHSFIRSNLNDDEFQPVASAIAESPRGKSSVTKPTSSFSAPATFISTKEIEAVAETIQCAECRRSVEKLLLQPERSRQRTQILLEGVHVSTKYDTYNKQNLDRSNDNEEDIDEDFEENRHYQLMEEGAFSLYDEQHSEYDWTFELVTKKSPDSNESDQPVGWQIRRPMKVRQKTFVTEDIASAACEECWSMVDFEFLVNQYVLLLGLPPRTVTNDMVFEENVIASISKSVNSKVNNIFRKTTECGKDLAEKLDKMKKNLATPNTVNISWNSSSEMGPVDQSCDDMLIHLLDVVWTTTRSVQRGLSCIGASKFAMKRNPADEWLSYSYEEAYSDCQWSIEQCIELWRRYLSGIHTILCVLDTYETKLFSMADRHGNLPSTVLDFSAREFYRDYLEKKCFIVRETVGKVIEQLDHPTHVGGWTSIANNSSTTHFIRRVFTEEAFFEIVVNTHYEQPSLDKAYEDVAQMVVRELAKTVDHTSIRKIIEVHQKRDNDIMHLLSIVSKNVDAIISQATNASLEENEYLLELQQEISLLQIDECFASKDEEEAYRRAWRLQLVNGLKKAMKSFVQYPLYHNIGDTKKSEIPQLPHSLREAMLRDPDNQNLPCSGGNEQNRATCILLALFFRQLSDQCKEWHSQLIVNELLTNVDVDTMNSEQTTSSKAKKMKKKGKGRTGQNNLSQTEDAKVSNDIINREVEEPLAVVMLHAPIGTSETARRDDIDLMSNDDKNQTFEDHSIDMNSINESFIWKNTPRVKSTDDLATKAEEKCGFDIQPSTTLKGQGRIENTKKSSKSYSLTADCQDSKMGQVPASFKYTEYTKNNHVCVETQMEEQDGYELPPVQEIYSAVNVSVYGENENLTAEEFFVGRMELVLGKVSLAILLD